MLQSDEKHMSLPMGNFNPWKIAFILHQDIHYKCPLSSLGWTLSFFQQPDFASLRWRWRYNLTISNCVWWIFPVYQPFSFIGISFSLFTTSQSLWAAMLFSSQMVDRCISHLTVQSCRSQGNISAQLWWAIYNGIYGSIISLAFNSPDVTCWLYSILLY